MPLDLAGIWQRSAGPLTPVVLTEYGLAESRDTGVFDDPNVECRGYSIPRSTLSGFGVTKIEVGADHVIFRYEANAGTRKEEGENTFMARGVKGAGTVYPMGAAFTLYERYQLIANDTLDFVMVMQDPKILAIPRIIHAQWTRLPDDTPFLQEQCILPEDEFFKTDQNQQVGRSP